MDRREFLAAAATPLLLDAVPAFARSSGGTPLALVTADLESSIVAVNVATGGLRAVSNVSRQFRSKSSPAISGWCCAP